MNQDLNGIKHVKCKKFYTRKVNKTNTYQSKCVINLLHQYKLLIVLAALWAVPNFLPGLPFKANALQTVPLYMTVGIVIPNHGTTFAMPTNT